MSLTKLSLARNTLVSDIPAGDGKIANFFLQCIRKKDPSHELQKYLKAFPHLDLEASVVVEGDPFVGEVGVRTRKILLTFCVWMSRVYEMQKRRMLRLQSTNIDKDWLFSESSTENIHMYSIQKIVYPLIPLTFYTTVVYRRPYFIYTSVWRSFSFLSHIFSLSHKVLDYTHSLFEGSQDCETRVRYRNGVSSILNGCNIAFSIY